jgi:hypothetical protein
MNIGRNNSGPMASRALELLALHGSLRLRDLLGAGIQPSTVDLLTRSGNVVRIGRGTYVLFDRARKATALELDLLMAQTMCPDGVACLLTAAQLHGMTDENARVTLAVPRGATRPPGLGATFVTWQDARMFQVGVETRDICGRKVKVTNRARTVADLFRRRNRQFHADAASTLGQFLRDGGEIAEVSRIATELGFHADVAPWIGPLKESLKWQQDAPGPMSHGR